ncbi:MAG: DUF3006 domain-containing protein [Clostridia bacterium]|nr:DUF3006 domain-containing protein [Clostridia bacterium]
MKLIIDRFEEHFAICEIFGSTDFIEIDRLHFPENIKEGDVVDYDGNLITLDEVETKKRKDEINKKMENLLK